MDDRQWDDYLRQTEGTTMGDEARRMQERSQPKSGDFYVSGEPSGSSPGARRAKQPMSDTAAAVWLGLFYAGGAALAGYMYDMSLGWGVFFGIWAGLTIAQLIFPKLQRVMAWVFFVGIILYGIYAVVIATT